jgi:hypothetical protein
MLFFSFYNLCREKDLYSHPQKYIIKSQGVIVSFIWISLHLVKEMAEKISMNRKKPLKNEHLLFLSTKNLKSQHVF